MEHSLYLWLKENVAEDFSNLIININQTNMKKKFTLILASMFLCMGTAWAQLNFTFTRGTTLDNSSVKVTDIDGNEVSGVTANIAATAPSNAWNTGGAMANATHVLCANTNTSALSGSNITYTLTIEVLSANQAFDLVTYTHVAVNSGGNYQPANDTDIRHCNFSLSANSTEVESITDENIWIPAGKSSKDITFEKTVAANESGALTLTLTISKGTTNNGCFYGLTGITLQTYNSLLSALVAETEALYNTCAPNATKVGYYSQTALDAFKSAIDKAKAVTTATQADIDELQAAIDELSNADINLPEAGKYYVLRCNHESRYLYANTDNKMYYWGGGNYTAGDSRAVWQFEAGDTDGTFKMKSVHNQAYVPTVSNGAAIVFSATGADVTIAASSSAPGAVTFTAGNEGIGIHANANPVIGFTHGAAANHYFVEEVADFSHTLKVGAAEWSTLVLGFNATIPTAEGFNAYTIASVQDGYVTLEEATGVLAANVPVLVNAAQDSYKFAYTAEEATVTTSGLEGTLYDQNISATAYVLAKPAAEEGEEENPVGLYRAQLTDGSFLNNANKAYLVVAGAEAPMFSLGRGEGTTGIETAVNGEQTVVIYDLAGRRVEKMEKGIYIVNGKKVIK